MLCLGLKKSLSSPRLKLIAQGVAYQCSKVECEDHSAIQLPTSLSVYNVYFVFTKMVQLNAFYL